MTIGPVYRSTERHTGGWGCLLGSPDQSRQELRTATDAIKRDGLWIYQHCRCYRQGCSNSQLHSPHAVADSDQRLGHLALKLIDERQQITPMIPPARWRYTYQSGFSLRFVIANLHLRSSPRISSFKTPLCPCWATSAIQIDRIRLPCTRNVS